MCDDGGEVFDLWDRARQPAYDLSDADVEIEDEALIAMQLKLDLEAEGQRVGPGRGRQPGRPGCRSRAPDSSIRSSAQESAACADPWATEIAQKAVKNAPIRCT